MPAFVQTDVTNLLINATGGMVHVAMQMIGGSSPLLAMVSYSRTEIGSWASSQWMHRRQTQMSEQLVLTPTTLITMVMHGRLCVKTS